MTKKILSFLLSLFLVFGLASCMKSSPSIVNQEKVDQLKELLNKQDLSEFTSKGFACMFTQEYNVLDAFNDIDEEDKNTSFFNYISLGFLDSYYVITKDQYDEIVDDNGDINTFDAIAIGEGGYRITQQAKTASFSRDGGGSSSIINLDINQQMTLKTTEEDVIVYNILDVTDNQVFDYASRQKFAGSINKELLFSSVSTRAFREIFSKVNLFDSPGNVEYLDKLFFTICKNLKTKSDMEISNFIIENKISIEEVDDKLELSFVFQDTGVDDIYTDIIFPGTIKGTLTYDKATGLFEEFNYEIKYIEEKYDEESGSLKTANMIFTCQGKSTHGPIGSMWVPDDLTVFDNVIDYLEKVSEEVIPPSL